MCDLVVKGCGKKMSSDVERNAIIELLEVYHSLPALWDMKNEEYNSRTRKEGQYDILLKKFKDMKPDADKKELKKKINTLRTNFRRELKRKKDSDKKGEHFVTTLYYFDKMSFLAEMEETLSGLERPFKSSEEQTPPITMKKKRHRSTINSDELMELATKRLKQCDDYSQTLANVWAGEFRLASDEQKFFAKKAIDDILFEARLGTLHRNSVKINENIVNDYAEFNPGPAKREPYHCISPKSSHGSITIERMGMEGHENDDC